MQIFNTSIPDCIHFKPRVFEDERGYFFEGFNQKNLKEVLDIDFNIVQINQSMSTRGVLRGLHFQLPPYDQAKLVSVMEGEVLDVAVDLRKNSPWYGQHVAVHLSSENKHQLFIPRGFAHGFVVLSPVVKFSYGVDNFYSAAHDAGIIYSDPALAINWKLDIDQLIVSGKDQKHPTLSEFDSPFFYKEADKLFQSTFI